MNFSGTIPGWKSHWGAYALRKKHETIGDRSFQQGFRMRAYADSDYILPNFSTALELGKNDRIPRPLPPDWITFMGVDLSSEKRPGNVLFCGALTPYGHRWPLEIRCIKASSPKVASEIGAMNARWKCQAIMVENNAYQQSIIDWINDSKERFPWWYNVIAFQTGRNKADPVIGIPGIDVEFMNGAWRVPFELNNLVNGHTLSCKCGPCRWITETSNYPHSTQSDTTMSMWFFRECCRMWMAEHATGGGESEISDPTTDGVFDLPEFD